MNRRNLIKSLGISLGATIISTEALGRIAKDTYSYVIPKNPLHKPFDKAVTAITLGAGNRGNVYGGFAAKFPNELDIIGVAEPIPFRNERYSKIHNIEQNNRFNTWKMCSNAPSLPTR